MPISISVDVSDAADSAAAKVSRMVTAINFGAAYENEALYPVMETVMEWYYGLGPEWDAEASSRLAELTSIIESTPTEVGSSLVVTEPSPGCVLITDCPDRQ